MARKAYSLTTLLRYGLSGLAVGAILGAIAGAVYVEVSPPRFEAGVALFYKPDAGMPGSARDFLVRNLAQKDFLDGFVREEGSDPRIATLLSGGVQVAAQDASGPHAELKLAGSDEKLIGKTLDALAEYMAGKLQSAQEIELQAQSGELDEAVKAANRHYYDMVVARLDYGKLPSPVLAKIQAITDLARERFEIELERRYGVRRETVPEDAERQQRLSEIEAEEAALKRSVSKNPGIDLKHFEFESAFEIARAKLRLLEQTRRRLDGELDGSKTLRVLRRAQLTPVSPSHAPILMFAFIGALLGGLAGGFAWSARQSSKGGLSAPMVERRLGTPVLGVIARNLTNDGDSGRDPITRASPEPLAMAGVQSLNVALHLLAQEPGRSGPVIFADLGPDRHASQLIADLAVVSARTGMRVLIAAAGGGKSALARLCLGDKRIAQAITLDANELARVKNADRDDAAVRFAPGDGSAGQAETTDLPVPVDFIPCFDRVLIEADSIARARHLVEGYGAGIGLVVCTRQTRLSVLHKALGTTLHGVVLCDYQVNAADYLVDPTGL